MTIAVVVFLVGIGILAVNGDGQTSNGAINNCCCLGYNNNNFNTKPSKSYAIANFCGVKNSNAYVYCDTQTGGGGWTVIQRRNSGQLEFKNRHWVEYEDGFGSLSSEFWLGLRSMHCLTSSHGQWELRIDYQLSNGEKSYLHYSNFAVGNAASKYQLTISGFDKSRGQTHDPFDNGIPLNGMPFSAKDLSTGSCAKDYGGWWHNNARGCGYTCLNNQYRQTTIFIKNKPVTTPFVEMKIRPANCKTQ